MIGGGIAIQPRKKRIASREGKPRLDSRVAVIGGGLAGMSAALELAERGAKVTLFETSPHLGGRLGGWPVTALGEPFAMEHGFHGFFAQYYNLRDVLDRLRVQTRLTSRYPIAFADGGEESFSPKKRPFPLNLLQLYATSERLKIGDAMKPFMRHMLDYDPVATYAAFDDVPFSEFAKELDPGLTQAMLWPFAKTTLNRPEVTSAAHVLRFFHFYFLGNPEGLSYDHTRQDCITDVIAPWQARLVELGVDVRTGTRVRALDTENGRVTGVQFGTRATDVHMGKLPATLGEDPTDLGNGVFAWRRNGKTAAVSSACTHQGCPVRIVADGFLCPCHGGRFDREGVPTGGPPKRPLERLRIVDGDVIAPAISSEALAVDDVILACDVRGTRAIVDASSLAPACKRDVAALAEADPYLVVRAWLDGVARHDRAEFYTTTGFKLLDAIALYDRLQDPYAAYTKRTGRSVIELHAYAIDPRDDRGVEQNRDILFAEMRQALPELRDAKVLEAISMQQSNFSGFRPGSHATRPTTLSAHDNLFFAGDWVKTDLPVALMEAAVTTGRLAANAVLSRHGAATMAIDTVADLGLLA